MTDSGAAGSPESTKRVRRPSELDPRLIRGVNLVGASWAVANVVAVLAFLVIQLRGLGGTLFVYAPGGRSASPLAIPVPTQAAGLVAPTIVLVFVAVVVASWRFSTTRRAWLVVLVILLSWASSVLMTSIVVSAAAQVGESAPLSQSRALALIEGSADPALWIVGLVALATTIGIPLLLSRGKSARA